MGTRGQGLVARVALIALVALLIVPVPVAAADPSAAPDAAPSESVEVAAASPEAAPPALEGEPSPTPTPPPSEAPTLDVPEFTVTLELPSHQLIAGRQFSFTATVSPNPGEGYVQLYQTDTLQLIGGGMLDPATGVVEGTATINTAGTIGFKATYFGSSNADSATITRSVLIFNGSIEASLDPSPRNAEVIFTFALTANPGGGTVTWKVAGIEVQTGALDEDGTSSLAWTFTSAGYADVTATFNGHGEYESFTRGHSQEVVADAAVIAVDVPESPIPEGPLSVVATVTPNPGGGTIRYGRFGLDFEVAVASDGTATLDLGTVAVGYQTWEATFYGHGNVGSASTEFSFEVASVSTTVVATNRTTAVKGELPVTLTATVACCDTSYAMTGTVTFKDVVGGVAVNLGPATVNSTTRKATLSSSALRVGVHTITAVYSGNDHVIGSESAPVTVTVKADTSVSVTFARSNSSVYPYKDGFRDTVRLAARLEERATATFRIRNSSGVIKRTWSLGWKNPGPFSVAWDGRTASGGSLPAGTYKATATFTDVGGHTRSITVSVSLSLRRAAWKSAAYVRYGNQAASYWVDQGDQGAIYSDSSYTNGVIFDSGSMIRDCQDCGFAAGQYLFSLRTEGLEYRNLYVQVRGHGFSDREHPGRTIVVDPVTKKDGPWLDNCEFDQPGVTCGIPTDPKYVSATKKLEAWVEMTQAWGDAYDLYYLKLTYQYAVLI